MASELEIEGLKKLIADCNAQAKRLREASEEKNSCYMYWQDSRDRWEVERRKWCLMLGQVDLKKRMLVKESIGEPKA